MPSALAGRTALVEEDSMELTTQTWTVECSSASADGTTHASS